MLMCRLTTNKQTNKQTLFTRHVPVLRQLKQLPIKQRVICSKSWLLLSTLSEVKLTILLAWFFVRLCAISVLASFHSGSSTRRPKQNFYQLTRSKTCRSKSWNSSPYSIRNCNNLRTFKSKPRLHQFKLACTDCMLHNSHIVVIAPSNNVSTYGGL
jgi:hypothetical protein